MSYCLHPDCQKPQNPNGTKFCQSCGTKLLLAERYRAIKPIAQGGFGRTLLAEDEYKPSKPLCVIKQFYPQGQNNAGKAAELFQQEAVRLEQLGKYPQIPELFAHLEQDNRQYIVQEYIDGQDLAEELAETGVFREKQIRSLLGDLLPVLQFIHEGQVIHRDIKPENIIRRRTDGSLVLVDFGAAKYATGTALGKTGTTIGSAGYAAPEQTFGQAVFASDIYSLGVTCIHLLTDIEPFELYNAMESAFVWRHYLGDNSVSDQLGRVLDKMTQSVVKQRYKSAEGVMHALGLKVGTQTSNSKPSPQINRKMTQPSTPSLGRQSGTPAPVLKTASLLKASPATTIKKVSIPPRISYENLRLIATLPGSQGSLLCISISPDGKKVASCSGVIHWVNWFGKDDTVRIWDIDSRKLIHSLIGHSWWVYSVAFSPDGQTLATGAMDKTVKLWDAQTGQEKRTLEHPSLIQSVTFSPDGHTLASSCGNGDIKLWDVDTWREKYTLKGHSTYTNSIAISPDGQTLASCSSDKTIKLWNVSTGQEKHTIYMPKYPESVAFSPDGQFLACACYTRVKLWDVNTWQEKHTLDYGAKFATFSPDEQTLATGGQGGNIILWDVSTGREICFLREHSSSVESVAFSPDGQTLVSGCLDKTIKIWRVDG